jgi:hypothetical protein
MANDKEILNKMSDQLNAGKIIMVSTGTPIDNCPLTVEMLEPGFFTSTPHPPRAQLYNTKDRPQADGQYVLMRFDDPNLLSQLPVGPLSYVKDVSERIKGYQQPARGVPPGSLDLKQFVDDMEEFVDMTAFGPEKEESLSEKDIREVTTEIIERRRRSMTGHRGDLYCTDLKNKS